MEPTQPTDNTVAPVADPTPSEPLIIKRHPIGLFVIFGQGFLAIVALAAIFLLIVPDYFGHLSDSAKSLISIVGAIFIVVLVLLLSIAARVYRRNQLVVTDHDVEETSQTSLVTRKISRLELHDVEDVSFSQKGILQTIFGYGTLTVETAGAVDNFIFNYCPRPGFYCQKILDVRARYIAAAQGWQQPESP